MSKDSFFTHYPYFTPITQARGNYKLTEHQANIHLTYTNTLYFQMSNVLYLDNRGRLSTSHAFIKIVDGLGQVLRHMLESLAVPVVVLISEWLLDLEGNAIEP